MGKAVISAVAVVAAIAVVVAAPYLAPGVVSAFGALGVTISTAVATALITTTLSLAVGLAFTALTAGAPSARSATTAPQGTAIVGGFGPPPRYKLESRMKAPRERLPLRMWRLRLGRFHIIELMGDCMAPQMTDQFAIIDRKADIRRGDLFSFRTRDHEAAFGHYPGASAAVKRFVGADPDAGVLECDCTNPPRTIHTGLDNLLAAHRVIATAPTFKEARRLLKAVRRDRGAYDG